MDIWVAGIEPEAKVIETSVHILLSKRKKS